MILCLYNPPCMCTFIGIKQLKPASEISVLYMNVSQLEKLQMKLCKSS